MELLHFKIEKGQEVMEVLEKAFHEKGLIRGAIVSVIGAVDHCVISNMPKADATQDILKEFAEPFELSGTGEIRDGKPHIHCTLSGENNMAIHGHLHSAEVRTWYVSVYVIVG